MIDTPVSLNEVPPEIEPVATSVPDAAIVPPSEPALTRRAKSTHAGVGDLLKQSYEDVYQQISDGNEQSIKDNAALATNINNQQKRDAEMARMATRHVSLEEFMALQEKYKNASPIQPSTIVESEYGKNYIANVPTAAGRIQDTVLDDAGAQIPAELDKFFQKGSDLTAHREWWLKKAEDFQTEVDNQSYLGWGVDLAKQLIPGYNEVKNRGNNSNISFGAGGTLGENLDLQAKDYANMPVGDMAKAAEEHLKIFKDNPSLGAQYAQYMAGMSVSDKILNNILTPLEALGGYDLLKGGTKLFRTASVYNRAQKVVKDAVKSSAVPDVTKATIAEGLGDTTEAAVQNGLEAHINSLQGVDQTTKNDLMTLTSHVRADMDKVQANPGVLSREETTRLLDMYEGYGRNIIDTLVNSAKVDRVPWLQATEEGMRLIREKGKEYYAGKENTVLDMDVRRDPISGSLSRVYKLGNYDGGLFSSAEQAQAHADINGYGKIEIAGEAPERVYLAPGFAKNLQQVEKTPVGVKFFVGESSSEVLPAARTFNGYTSEQIHVMIAQARNMMKKALEGTDRQLLKDHIKEYEDGLKTLETKTVPTSEPGTISRGIQVIPTTEPQPGFIPYNLKTDKFEPALGQDIIAQKGLGFHIVSTRPVSEVDDWVRNGLIWGKEAESSSSATGWRAGANAMFGGLLGRIRGASDTLSMQETVQRLKTVYTQNRFLALAKSEMKYVESVIKGKVTEDPITGGKLTIPGNKVSYYRGPTPSNKTRFEEFNRALQAARNLKDDKGLPGRWFQNPMELHNYYVANFERPPAFEETAAYFAFVRAYDYDLQMRNIRMFANKSRLGGESWVYNSVQDGQKVSSPAFDGIQKTRLPRTNDIMLVHNVNGSSTLVNTEGMDTKARKTMEGNMAQGRGRLVEVYDPESRPFEAYDVNGNKVRVRYVYSNGLENSPLSYNQIGRREGGHFEYDYSHYIKQAKIRSETVSGKKNDIYEGDATLAPVENSVMGKDLAGRFDVVRNLLLKGDNVGARDYAKANLDLPWKELRGWFKKTKDPVSGLMQPPRFNLTEPFHVVPNGMTIHDIDKTMSERYGNFKNGTREGSLARNFLVNYTQARDAYDMFTFKDIGNKNNPVYKYLPSSHPEFKFVDPLPTLTRSLDRIVNSTYMDDYKIYAVEHWLQENGGLLAKSQSEIRGSPFYHFNEAANDSAWRKPTTETYPMHENAWTNYLKIKELLGTPSTFDTSMQYLKQSLNDLAYEKLGPVSKKVMVVPDWLLDKVPEPLSKARSLAFHAKLGLYNVSQLVSQNMNWVNILALSPGHVMQGSFGALMHQWSRIAGDDAMKSAMGGWAEKFGWKPGHLEEAMKTLDKTGFGVVGGEYALDQSMKHYYIRNGARQFLDYGQTFFKEAERNQRYAAWYTAFHEWRTLNPTVTVGERQIGQILSRADDLTTNMSRASNSMLNKGIFSIPAQFLSYQYRLGELFWSKRIGETLAERTKNRAILYGTYAALYGLPGALGVSGLPLGDYIRKAAIEHGYNLGEDAIQSFFMEGGLSTIGALITGSGDVSQGNFYNWNDKVGANGFSPIREALRSNASLWKIIGGAAGSTIGNTITSADGWFHAMNSMLSGKTEEEAFPMKKEDWLDLANEVSSMSSARRMIYAFNYGKWLTKNEAYVGDTSKTNAVFMALTGLSPQEVDDKYVKSWTKTDEDSAQKDAVQKFTKNFRRAAQAAADDDQEQSQDYYRRAFNELKFAGYPLENYGKVVGQAAEGYENIIDRSDYSYYMKDVPEYRKDTAVETYRNKIEMNQRKKQ